MPLWKKHYLIWGESFLQLRAASEIGATVSSSASVPALSLEDSRIMGVVHATLTNTIRQSVAAEKSPGREGSLSCFLSVVKEKGDQAVTCALMSCHVEFPSMSNRYKFVADTDAPEYMISPG